MPMFLLNDRLACYVSRHKMRKPNNAKTAGYGERCRRRDNGQRTSIRERREVPHNPWIKPTSVVKAFGFSALAA